MCVIITAESHRPSTRAIDLALAANPDGAGIAWIDNGKVRFLKGVGADVVEEVCALAATVPVPFIVHFRITTVGETCDALCHPFPLSGGAMTRTKGVSKRGVLFHNGTWKDWRGSLLQAATASGMAIGDGPMSDSRAMAHLAIILGTSILGAIEGQRIAVLTPRGIERFGDGWTEIITGVHASNMRWAVTRPTPPTTTTTKAEPKPAKKKAAKNRGAVSAAIAPADDDACCTLPLDLETPEPDDDDAQAAADRALANLPKLPRAWAMPTIRTVTRR
jgi:hypothetical protein